MTRIWRETGFVDTDPWVAETEEVQATESQTRLLDIDTLVARAEESNDVGLGVLLKPADDVMRLEPYLDRLAIVAVSFPAFNDGRGFSQASLLRQRLGYAGEVRAMGDVLIDQVPLMLRCGFDSFSVTNATALKRLSENRLPGIQYHYQPTAQPAEAGQGYSWRRISPKTA
ncbi:MULTISPECIES: DUF934 domain-containing protein [unclassified Rhizobium]|uniref:DUF934 domain-containing protein n=1 Tax=unclassified Rhizobium TaxID=2613769 RepID=UPI001ADC1C24|nr:MULTISPECIES: DUF934 domain-containing protein [unclassified Rhizobium]MBO9098341.1 DUF934 domain-containing protein [Rhizobium sp. L58/93]MBO9132855.1 DUF934 domain-containing protein [Rhizobium sp. B209b/85]MBO9168607.1 DUF934 domain-containing protein [Rhizobium sp. L245/93]MBO9184536.1 DUF934 domain-containing protein [Rhizobium sp. E27B/91]QXZ84739.1 DUF934 domain-containing protein [Rhizobium sp. K1/93]